jgi:hypothetical protein
MLKERSERRTHGEGGETSPLKGGTGSVDFDDVAVGNETTCPTRSRRMFEGGG